MTERCKHQMERQQHWDECILCGARWTPEDGFNVPMNESRSRQPIETAAQPRDEDEH
jgi:hypothetical protein